MYGGRKKSPRTSSLVQLPILSALSGSSNVNRFIRIFNTAEAGSRGIDSFAPLITVNEQSESNPDCSFASGRSYHQNLFISTLAGVNCLCGGRKSRPFFVISAVIYTFGIILCNLSYSKIEYRLSWC